MKYKISSWCGDEVTFMRQDGQGNSITRKMTPGELKLYKGRWKKKSVHTVFHKFLKAFTNGGNPPEYKWKGYDLMKRIEKWSSKYPKDIFICGCDDSYSTGSDLVLIEHKTPDYYMGTTVVYIPQCSGEDPIKFFLYPGHLDNLVSVLQKIAKIRIPITKRYNQEEQKYKNMWAVKPKI